MWKYSFVFVFLLFFLNFLIPRTLVSLSHALENEHHVMRNPTCTMQENRKCVKKTLLSARLYPNSLLKENYHAKEMASQSQSHFIHTWIWWNFRGFRGICMDFFEFPRISWNFTGFRGISMDFVEFPGISWNFRGFHGISWDFMEFPRDFLESNNNK